MLGQRKLLQRLGAGADPRVHLLGLPRAGADDRDRDDRRGRPSTRRSRGSATRAGTRCWSTSSRCWCWSAWSSALCIRKVVRPKRFEGSHLGEADLILALIATIVITLLLWHASRIALGLNEWPADWAPVSHLLSHLFADNQTTRVLERVFVWIHVLTILAFLAYLPRSKHLHIASAAFNVWFGRTGPGGRLEPLRFDDPTVPEEEIRFGAGTAADLTWKEMLDTYSCTECGRCQDACPAFATGKTLSPKLVIMGLRDQVFADGASVIKLREGERGAASWRRWSERGARGVGLGLRHLRRLRAGLPGLDRARRPHRRPAPAPGDGRVDVPGRGRADAARHRARLEPVGQGAVRARRLGRRPRGPGARARRRRARVPLLGRLRVVVRRARADDRREHGQAAASGPGSTSRSSAPARPAPATRRGGWATSTCSRRSPSRTSRRSTRPASRRSSPTARTASTRSPTSTRTSAATTR